MDCDGRRFKTYPNNKFVAKLYQTYIPFSLPYQGNMEGMGVDRATKHRRAAFLENIVLILKLEAM